MIQIKPRRHFMSQKKISESQLVGRLKQGDKQALHYWFKHYQPALIKIAIKKAKSKKDANDLVQETFINSYKQIQLFKENSSLLTWMVSILRHEIADYYRKKYAKKAIKTIPLGDYLLRHSIQDSKEVSQKVRQVLSQMLDRRKKLLLMKYVDGLKVKEIAHRVDRTFKAVEADLYRARESFKNIYSSLS